MRLAPVPMFFVNDLEAVVRYSAHSSRTTHGAQEAVDACKLFGVMIALALRGEDKETVLFEAIRELNIADISPKIAAIGAGAYRAKPHDEIRGRGYVVDSLEAALWVFLHTEDYKSAVLAAVNLGDDADTTGAVLGQLAGAYYGADAIPAGWLEKLAMRDLIKNYALRLYQERPGNKS